VALDPYFVTLSELRDQLAALFQGYGFAESRA
jgi:hypothetical protein